MSALDNLKSNLSKVSFTNLVNFLKIDPSSGSGTCPSLTVGSGYTQTVSHNLGYIPHFEVYQEQSAGGAIVNSQMQVVKEMGTGTVTLGYPNAMDYLNSTGGYIYATTTQLIIHFYNDTSGTSSSFKFWWRIYLQYGSQT